MSILRNGNVAYCLCRLFSSMSHVKLNNPMSLHFYHSCRMSLSPMSHVEFKKCPCDNVEFRGQEPYQGRPWDAPPSAKDHQDRRHNRTHPATNYNPPEQESFFSVTRWLHTSGPKSGGRRADLVVRSLPARLHAGRGELPAPLGSQRNSLG